MGLRLEDLERKMEGGLDDLRQAIRAITAGRGGADPGVDDLLDALDLLGEAAREADRAAHPFLAEGLRRVAARIESFLARRSIRRLAPLGLPPDAGRFRIVGTADAPDLPPGAVAHVVRAAVLEGDRLLREGEVLVNRSAPT